MWGNTRQETVERSARQVRHEEKCFNEKHMRLEGAEMLKEIRW